jgi:hypothetical protein
MSQAGLIRERERERENSSKLGKTLFINTKLIRKMYKAIINKREFKRHQDSANYMSKTLHLNKLIACDNSTVVNEGCKNFLSHL